MDEQEINRYLEAMTLACRHRDLAERLMKYAEAYGTQKSVVAAWQLCLFTEEKFDEANNWLIEHDLEPVWDEEAQKFVLPGKKLP